MEVGIEYVNGPRWSISPVVSCHAPPFGFASGSCGPIRPSGLADTPARPGGGAGRWLDAHWPAPPAVLEPEELAGKLARLRTLTRQAGRPERAVTPCFSTDIVFERNTGPSRRMMTGRPEQIAADLRQYQDLGVANFILGFRADSVAGQREAMEQFSREVVPLIPQE